VSLTSLSRAIPTDDRILLDSTCLIAYLDGGETVTPVARHIIDEFVHSGRNRAIISMVSAMEVLGQPRRASLPIGYSHAYDFLTRFPNLRAESVDLPVAQEAAHIRSSCRLRAPDALIVATGMVHQVSHLVTNDSDWQRRLQPIQSRIAVCLLSDHVPFP
jgi:predicted nucleic acid-binding protein